MVKQVVSKVGSLVLALVMVLSLMPVSASAAFWSKPRAEFSVPDEVTVGETVRVDADLSSDVRKVSWTLRRDGRRVNIQRSNKDSVTFTPSRVGDYTLTCMVFSRSRVATYVDYFEVVEEQAVLEITEMSVPEVAEVGVPFEVYGDAVGAEHFEWYVNKDGEDYPVPGELDDHSGALCFDEPGEYDIIYIVYDEDWEHVSKTMQVTVQESVVPLEILDMQVPETAVAGESFEVFGEASGAYYTSWYVNKDGEDYPVPGELDDNGGALCFEEPGVYDIIYMVFDEDWNHVHKTMSVMVYADDVADSSTDDKVRAMYSWSSSYVEPRKEDLLQQVMELTNCNTLYQDFSSSTTPEEAADFLSRRAEAGQSVWYLCGDASWGIEPDAASMLEEIERALYLQSESDVKFEGIQFDVEPYCLDDFDENADAYFAQYVENCKTAYAAAHAAGLKVELCVPYWYDSSYGYNDQLEDLIANACDSIAVMNYYKNDKEIKHIASELELCRKYDKPIVNITEMQKPGTHGLTENNTYYHDGVEAVEEMWSEMEAYFGYEKLGYSYHYLNTMVELFGL